MIDIKSFLFKKQYTITAISFVALSFITKDAQAQQTLGSVLKNFVDNSDDSWILAAAAAMAMGMIMGIMGILKLKEHVEKGDSQVPIWDPLKRLLAGGAFFSLPMIVTAVRNTLTNGDNTGVSGSSYKASGADSAGLDGMLVAFMADIWDDFHLAIVFFCWIAGLFLLIIGISRLLKTEQDGPKGPLGFGTIMTFLVAGALFSVNVIVKFTSNTLFNSGVKANAALAYDAGLDAQAMARANAVIAAIMAFVAVIGWISFVRGVFMMRGVAEGNSQVSSMAAFTHIIGGAIAINLGAFIDAVQNTLSISSYGLNISYNTIEPYLTTVTMLA